jgi:hypothetical protein
VPPIATPPGPRVRLSAMLGAGLPFGRVGERAKVSDLMPTPFLLGADAAWGPVPSFDVGITSLAMIGVGTPELCPEPTETCGVTVGGFGFLRGRYYFRPLQAFDPWVGLGAGIEVLGNNGQTTEVDGIFDMSTTTSVTDFYFGPVFGILQAGFDYRVHRSLSVGSSLGLAIGRYTSVKRTVEVDGEKISSSSRGLDAATHEWLLLTAHVTFDVPL